MRGAYSGLYIENSGNVTIMNITFSNITLNVGEYISINSANKITSL